MVRVRAMPKCRKFSQICVRMSMPGAVCVCVCVLGVAGSGCNFGFLINVKMCDGRRLRDPRRMRERDFQNRMGTI